MDQLVKQLVSLMHNLSINEEDMDLEGVPVGRRDACMDMDMDMDIEGGPDAWNEDMDMDIEGRPVGRRDAWRNF